MDPHKEQKAVDELEWALSDLGLQGLTIGPWEHNLYPSDEKYFPLFELCVKHEVPVTIHASVHFGQMARLDYSRPIYIDDVAVIFPELKIIAVHGGWPWVAELVAITWRHKNVYIDISASVPNTSERMAQAGNLCLSMVTRLFRTRVLWGTAWPLQPFARSLEEVRALPLKPHVIEKWIHGNSASLLGVG